MIGLLLYNLYFSIVMFLSIILISLHVQVAFWQLWINEHDDDDMQIGTSAWHRYGWYDVVAGSERLSPITWRGMVNLKPGGSFSVDCCRGCLSSTAANCSADKDLKAIAIRGVIKTQPGWSSWPLPASRLEHSMQSRTRHAMAIRMVRSPYRTRAQLVITLSMWVVIVRLYVRVTTRTEMCWTFSKPCTMGGGRSVCRQDLGLVNTISLDLDRLSFRLLVLAHCSICWISAVYLRQGGCFHRCLSVNRITQELLIRTLWNFKLWLDIG